MSYRSIEMMDSIGMDVFGRQNRGRDNSGYHFLGQASIKETLFLRFERLFVGMLHTIASLILFFQFHCYVLICCG